MKIKVSEADRHVLDYLVAKCEGYTDLRRNPQRFANFLIMSKRVDNPRLGGFSPTEDWAQGGPIIEREYVKLDVKWSRSGGIWYATIDTVDSIGWWSGTTPLIAAMRCYVASKLGDEVEVPDELMRRG